jgi:hypothetical protein
MDIGGILRLSAEATPISALKSGARFRTALVGVPTSGTLERRSKPKSGVKFMTRVDCHAPICRPPVDTQFFRRTVQPGSPNRMLRDFR